MAPLLKSSSCITAKAAALQPLQACKMRPIGRVGAASRRVTHPARCSCRRRRSRGLVGRSFGSTRLSSQPMVSVQQVSAAHAGPQVGYWLEPLELPLPPIHPYPRPPDQVGPDCLGAPLVAGRGHVVASTTRWSAHSFSQAILTIATSVPDGNSGAVAVVAPYGQPDSTLPSLAHRGIW